LTNVTVGVIDNLLVSQLDISISLLTYQQLSSLANELAIDLQLPALANSIIVLLLAVHFPLFRVDKKYTTQYTAQSSGCNLLSCIN